MDGERTRKNFRIQNRFAIARENSEWESAGSRLTFLPFPHKGRFRKLDKDESLKNISDYLLYGTVLGIKSKAIKEMIGFIPESDFHSVFPWYAYGGGDGHGNPADGFSASFSAMVSTTSSAKSSASGAGGGASSGGGGGAGGGGGGAG